VSNNSNPDRKQVFIGSLHYDATEQEIVDAFTDLGVRTLNVRIPRDKDTDRPKGYAFVDVDPDNPLSVEEIISGIDGTPFRGRPCRADKVNAKPERENRRRETPSAFKAKLNEAGRQPRRGGRGRDHDSSW
jgi:RNA recognition motif-containing protein